MTLLSLVLLLVAPYALLSGVERVRPGLRTSAHTRGKIGLSMLLLATGSTHFTQPEAMAAMLPPAVPLRIEIIYLTGVLELLGAIGIWLPGLSTLAGACIVLLLIGVLPANVYAALNHVPFGGHDSGPLYLLVRIPFQALLIVWTYRATGQSWFAIRRKAQRALPTAAA